MDQEIRLYDLYYRRMNNDGKLVWLDEAFMHRLKELRKNQTAAENILWQKLRRKQLGSKFLRQHPINGYVVDFYSRTYKLAIELDGAVHHDIAVKFRDAARQKELEFYGVRFLRFTNEEVINQLDGVIEKIKSTIRNHLLPSRKEGQR